MPIPSGPFGPETGTPLAPKFAEITFLGHTVEANTNNKACNQVTHWRTLSSLAGGTQAQLGINVVASFSAAVAAAAADSYTLDIVRTKFIDNPLTVPDDNPCNIQGTVNTDRAASFTAAVIRKVSYVPSRNYRGSLHYGAIPETFTTTDDLNATGLAALNAIRAVWVNLLGTGLSDGTNLWYPIVLSTTLSNRIANPSIFYGAWLQTFTLNTRLGTMRRRKEK